MPERDAEPQFDCPLDWRKIADDLYTATVLIDESLPGGLGMMSPPLSPAVQRAIDAYECATDMEAESGN